MNGRLCQPEVDVARDGAERRRLTGSTELQVARDGSDVRLARYRLDVDVTRCRLDGERAGDGAGAEIPARRRESQLRRVEHVDVTGCGADADVAECTERLEIGGVRRELQIRSRGAPHDDLELGPTTPRDPEAAGFALRDAHGDLVAPSALRRVDPGLGGGGAREVVGAHRSDVDVDPRLVPRLHRHAARRDVEPETDVTGCLEGRHRSVASEPGRRGGSDVDSCVALPPGAPALDGIGVEWAEECVREHDCSSWFLAPGVALEPI